MSTAAVAVPAAQKSGHIASLDGWRGIAILLVLADHFASYPVHPWHQYLGQHGVTLFFVLSGFLITRNLLDEQERGGIQLRAFYIRRAFRLWPVAWCFLVFAAFRWMLPASEIASCLFFLRNCVDGSLGTAHFWSLSIEEQFYLFWPALVLMIPRKRLAWFAALVAVGIAIHRHAHWSYYNSVPLWESFRTDLRADALLVGCLLAILMRDARFRTAIGRIPLFALLPLFAACIYRYHHMVPLHESVLMALMLGCTAERGTKVLCWRPLCYLGELSYGLYVWQEPFDIYFHHSSGIPWVELILIFACAFASYRLIERPYRNYGRRLASRYVAEPSHVVVAT